jgi:sugar O-acyltransferase (sialic acid O-acetyltransferase NeuD family)
MLEEILKKQNLIISAVFDNDQSKPSPFENVPIYHDKIHLHKFENHFFVVAIGGGKGMDRVTISHELMDLGLTPIRLIHPTAYVANSTTLHDGIQVLPQAKICARVCIGEFSIVNTGASVDHECTIGKGVHIAPGATLCGCVNVGDYSFIGANATVLPRIKIGKNVVIGAGAVVTKNVDDNTTLVGNPARVMRKYA